MSVIRVAGLDGSLRNFGVAIAEVDLETLDIRILSLHLNETKNDKTKKIRKSSDLFERAKSLHYGVIEQTAGCRLMIGEIPSGGQSYDAVIGFGIVIGIYSSLPIPMLEVSPTEAKKAVVGTRTASKEEMIEWAFKTYPNAPWLTMKRGGEVVPVLKNEHLADACAAIHAGIRTPAFKQLQSILSFQPALAA